MDEIGQIFQMKGRKRTLVRTLKQNGYFIHSTHNCIDTLNRGEPGNSTYAGRIDPFHGEILSTDEGLSKILREYNPR